MRRCLMIAAILAAAIPPAIAQEGGLYRTTTPFREGRQMYGTVVVGDFLYLLGGNNEADVYTKDVDKARINQDGTLGEWSPTTPLPQSRAYISNTTVGLGDSLYVVQGLDGENDEKTRTITWSRQAPDGELGPWQVSAECPAPGVSCGAAVSTPGKIHLIGGSLGQSKPSPMVWSVPVGADGSPGQWSLGPALPTALWFHCAGYHGGKVYVWGGLRGAGPDSASDTILVSSLTEAGDLSPWSALPGKLEQLHFSGSQAVSGNFLLSFCPRDPQGLPTGDVLYCKMGPDGPGKWIRRDAKLPARHYIGVASDFQRGTVYLPGGRMNKEDYVFDKTTYFFRLAGERSVPVRAIPVAAVASAPAKPSVPPPATENAGTAPPLPAVFVDFAEGRKRFQEAPRPSAILLYNPTEAAAARQISLLSQLPPQSFPADFVFVGVDVTVDPATAGRFGVKESPVWVFYDKAGSQVAKKAAVMAEKELGAALQLISP